VDADTFAGHRPRLFSVAYRMLGSATDAEDVLQAAWLRVAAAQDVREPAAFLTTVVTRLCLDELGSARRRREEYVGPWLPEPVPDAELGPLDTVEQREQVRFGALLLLERLSPSERAVCVLRDGFDYPYRELAEVLGLSEAGCRQLHRRARARLEEGTARFEVEAERHVELTFALLAAAQQGDLAALEDLLASDVVLHSDGGGRVRAARRLVRSRDHVARFLAGIASGLGDGLEVLPLQVNSTPGLRVRTAGGTDLVALLQVGPAGVERVFLVSNPDKLGRLAS